MNGLTKALMTSVAMTSNKDTRVLVERRGLWGRGRGEGLMVLFKTIFGYFFKLNFVLYLIFFENVHRF
jgi:hypothetical protein